MSKSQMILLGPLTLNPDQKDSPASLLPEEIEEGPPLILVNFYHCTFRRSLCLWPDSTAEGCALQGQLCHTPQPHIPPLREEWQDSAFPDQQVQELVLPLRLSPCRTPHSYGWMLNCISCLHTYTKYNDNKVESNWISNIVHYFTVHSV